MSKTVVGPVPVEMGPMEKKFVYYLNSEIKRLIALADKISVSTNPETLLELSTQIKYLRDITFKIEKSQSKLCEVFEKSNLEFFPRLMQENNVALANTQREISKLSASLNLHVEKNNAPSTEHLDSLQDNITSSIRQNLITEVRVHNQKDNRNLTTMIEDKFNKLFERLDTIENKLQTDLPVLNHDIGIIKRDITYLRENTPHQIASPPITKKSASPAEHFTKTESNRATPPHMTPYIEDRGPRRSEKEVSKLLPPLTEWVSFSGTGEYDYVEFIQFCDLILETYWAKDEIITIRLPRLFKDVANKWWKTKSTAIGQVDCTASTDCSDWPVRQVLVPACPSSSRTRPSDESLNRLVRAVGGRNHLLGQASLTSRRTLMKAFTASRLDPAQHVVATWCLDQKKRLDCFSPDLTQAEANRRILEQCRGDLSHGIKCRTSLDIDLTVLISTMEEVIEDIGLNKKYSKDFSNKPKNENSTTPPTANKPETGAPRRTVASGVCFNCGDKNHRKHECPNPQKKVMAVEGNPVEEEEEPQDSDEEPHSDLEVMNTTPEDNYRYEVIHADIGDEISINAIQGDSNLPQSWEPSMELGHVSEAKLLTNKPETGRCYTLGKTSYTTVIFQNSPTKALLDIGVFCSCTSSSFLDECYPSWSHHLLPVPRAKFSSCNASMKALGIVVMPLIFPHSKGSLRLSVELVVMQDTLCDYLILGNDTFCMCGIDIFQSKNRFYGDWKKKFQICHINTSLPEEVTTANVEINQELSNFETEYLSQAALSTLLTPPQKFDILQTCFEYKEAFCTSEEPIGNITGHDMEIELTVQAPYPPLLRRPPYPSSPKSREALSAHIQELLDLKVLRKVGHNEQVDITTPVIIAWHNDKSRMVGDFRCLNTYTKPDYYPIPRIDHSLHNLSKAKYITAMDVLKGFHQIPIHPESRKFMRIICHLGIYEYLRMPFGIKNAPSHFQRMMDSVFGSYIRQGWMMVYIDDILIYSDDWETHISKIKIVLQTATNTGLKMSIKKCNFGYGELKALGHIVSGLSLAIDQNKVAAVLLKDMPQNKTEMQSFLGFCSYYRQYIENFALKSKSLYELCNNDTLYKMTHQRVVHFEELCIAMTTEPVLAQPDYDKPFLLYIDACLDGLGAALHQEFLIEDKLIEKPILFISRQIKSSKKRYGASQMECLALVWSLEKLHYYLEGSRFVVITDCTAVRTLMHMKTPNRHMLRWQIAIQQYRGSMTIIHKSGAKHKNADGLSRWALPNTPDNPAFDPEDEEIFPILGIHACDLDAAFYDLVRQSYSNNCDLNTLISILQTDKHSPELVASLPKDLSKYYQLGKFSLFDGLLYFRHLHSSVIVLNHKSHILSILNECHDNISSGHLSEERTVEKIKQTAWWIDWKNQVHSYCKSCDTCQKSNKQTGTRFGLLQKISEPTARWEIINMDFVTGLPPGGSYSYNLVLVVVDCQLATTPETT
ncbi:hypothetical protein MJO28_007291 [Puccinia striiformis f. sp. tritici]|uniref:Uncharacterized protein n=1 Tax=Puccinia striiformis f. sp. tritici TaxID=168172 RepID=A0ACC0EFJ6_9BASI|nr:hypothetical protein MJO28_007291 [Puccinia striiformis f. sp. tritici]